MTRTKVDTSFALTSQIEFPEFIKEHLPDLSGKITLQSVLRLLPKLIYEVEKFTGLTGPEKKQFITNVMLNALRSISAELVDQASLVVPDAIDAIVLAFNSNFSNAGKRKAFWAKLNCCSA